jgi:hypothetical protein
MIRNIESVMMLVGGRIAHERVLHGAVNLMWLNCGFLPGTLARFKAISVASATL